EAGEIARRSVEDLTTHRDVAPERGLTDQHHRSLATRCRVGAQRGGGAGTHATPVHVDVGTSVPTTGAASPVPRTVMVSGNPGSGIGRLTTRDTSAATRQPSLAQDVPSGVCGSFAVFSTSGLA